MELIKKEIKIISDGTIVECWNDNTLLCKGSLRDATEQVEELVLVAQYLNGLGNFNPDHTISAMVTNLDIKTKMESIIVRYRSLLGE